EIAAELPFQVGGLESTRQVEEIGGELPEPPVDLLLDGRAVHDEADGPADGRVGEEGMRGLDARALAVDFLQGIGEVDLDELGRAARRDEHPALASLLEPLEHVV